MAKQRVQDLITGHKKRGLTPRHATFAPEKATIFKAPNADESALFGSNEEVGCTYCQTPLRHPRFSPPLSASGMAIPLNAAGMELLGGKVLSCHCCALERHLPTLKEHLAMDHIMVLVWKNSSQEVWPPALVVRALRSQYAWLNALDKGIKEFEPSHRPLLNDPASVFPAFEHDNLQFMPIWASPEAKRGRIDAFIRDNRVPTPLPKPRAPLSTLTADPAEAAWLGPAWALVVEKAPDLWRSLRGDLLLIPRPALALNPYFDARADILSLVPPTDERTINMLLLAGMLTEEEAQAKMRLLHQGATGERLA